jgi:hypothetical protein
VKRATCLVVAVSALGLICVAGCGSGSKGAGTVDPKALGLTNIPKMGQATGTSPELEMMRLKSPQDKTNYLRNLDKDSNFDPKKHTEMLETYAKDNDPDLAQTAKDLLERAK